MYQDVFATVERTWRFAERRLHVLWTETRTLEEPGFV